MSKIFIIAEAGVNHNGDISIAKKLVDAAAAAGADAIKFQTFKADSLAVPNARKAEYQLKNTNHSLSQHEMLKQLELSYENFTTLFYYCSQKNIQFISSPFDEESIDFLDRLGVTAIKIPSGEITNYSYLKRMAALKEKKIIMSTGMADLSEIENALNILKENPQIILLHCSSIYPTPMKDANLKAIVTLKQHFCKETGFSDHTLGIEASIGAAALGACVIEKHLTLNKSMTGPDHKMSLMPDEFKKLVNGIRNIELALGTGVKEPTIAELENRKYVRKCLVAAKDIQSGEAFTYENICAKRADNGISPMELKNLIGKSATRNYKKNERITL